MKYLTFWLWSSTMLVAGVPLKAAEDPDSLQAKSRHFIEIEATKPNTKMLQIPGGTFDGHIIKPFYLDKNLTTADEYRLCVQAGVCPPPADNGATFDTYYETKWGQHPVTEINWFNAKTYCEWLGKRLVDEWEWEWAARGREKAWEYPWGNSAPQDNSACFRRYDFTAETGQGTCAVGKHNISRDGITDMTGNMWTWTSSYYDTNQQLRVLRGGAWYGSSPEYVSVRRRGFQNPYSRDAVANGVRCAKSTE